MNTQEQSQEVIIDMAAMWAGEIERCEAELDAAEEADRIAAEMFG